MADIIGTELAEGPALSTRYLSQEHLDMADQVAEEIRIKFDRIADRYNGKAMTITGL